MVKEKTIKVIKKLRNIVTMGSTKVTLARRNQVSLCLAKSMNRPEDIARQLNIPYNTVRNDLNWMKKNSSKWLMGHTLNGYIFETQKAIDQISDIILELQSLRSKEQNIDRKIRIMHELADKINMKWVMQGEGPTLMNIRTVNNDSGR